MNDPQNDMLEAWKKANPDFGPQPKPAVPVFHNDPDRLEEARRALKEVMNLAFLCDVNPAANVHNFKSIWNLANVALARTSKAETVDTVP